MSDSWRDQPRHPRGSSEGGRWAEKVSARMMPGQVAEAYGTDQIAGSKFLTVKQRLTRCYQLAGHALVLGDAPNDAKLVHGTIHHVLADHEINHAWLELPDGSVWEPIEGKHWDPDQWRMIFRPRDEVKYTRDEAMARMLESGTYGPW